MMASLKDSVKKKESKQSNEQQEKETAAVLDKIKGKGSTRWGNAEENKAISGWVNREQYDKFTRINKARGLSNNKRLNLLISDYVIQYEHLLNN